MSAEAGEHRGEGAATLEELARLLRGASAGEAATMGASIQARAQRTLGPGLVRHFAGKLAAVGGDRGEADELAQQAWIEFWSAVSSGKYDPARARLSTFLYAVAQIVWMRDLRRRGRIASRERPLEAAWDAEGGDSTPGDAAELAARIDAVRRVMSEGGGELTEQDRAVLRAISEGASDREVAAQFGVSPSTAHERKRSALARLAGVLRGLGFGEDSGRAPGGRGA